MDEAKHPDIVCKNILTHVEPGTLLMHYSVFVEQYADAPLNDEPRL